MNQRGALGSLDSVIHIERRHLTPSPRDCQIGTWFAFFVPSPQFTVQMGGAS
jgi:hypothetical protein